MQCSENCRWHGVWCVPVWLETGRKMFCNLEAGKKMSGSMLNPFAIVRTFLAWIWGKLWK